MKARTVVGRGENGRINDRGPELRLLGPEKEKKKRQKKAVHGTSKE